MFSLPLQVQCRNTFIQERSFPEGMSTEEA